MKVDIQVVGAGVAGLCCALELLQAGYSVEVVDRAPQLGASGCSWFAGGMLAPFCEGENAHALVTALGNESLDWWKEQLPNDGDRGYSQSGSLVVAQGRDRPELDRFSRRSQGHVVLGSAEVAQLEPDLAGSFDRGLFYKSEAHINPRGALAQLAAKFEDLGGRLLYGKSVPSMVGRALLRVDCRGLAARDTLSDLRGVKGEMLLVHTNELSLSRPVRLLHPRIPLYVVPRADGVFMIGATMLESDDRKGISARSMIELLQGAYALHPAFAEAEVIEIGTEVRPAFVDNLPRIRKRGSTYYVNGLYRHGFLLAPTLAVWLREMIRGNSQEILQNPYASEVIDEYPMQRSTGRDSIDKSKRSFA